jgi:hypothetical protein
MVFLSMHTFFTDADGFGNGLLVAFQLVLMQKVEHRDIVKNPEHWLYSYLI